MDQYTNILLKDAHERAFTATDPVAVVMIGIVVVRGTDVYVIHYSLVHIYCVIVYCVEGELLPW